MAVPNPDNVQAGSMIAGLADLGVVEADRAIASFTVASGAVTSYTLSLPFARNDVISLTRVKLTGEASPIGNYWYPVTGSFSIRNINPPNSLDYTFTVESAANGRTLRFWAANNTGASSTAPDLHLYAHVHLYAYPF